MGLLAIAMTGFAAPMAGGHAAADECFAAGLKPYRVLDLGVIGPTFPSGSTWPTLPQLLRLPLAGRYTFGINRHLEVVWFALTDDDDPPEVRAFVHLPVAKYGLAAGTHELPIPSGAPGGGQVAAALDINDDGIIVGLVGASLFEGAEIDAHAFVWRLDLASSQSPAAIPDGEQLDLEELVGLGCFSIAMAITNDEPIEIAGTGLWNVCPDPCDPLNEFPRQPHRGFRVELDDPATAIALAGIGGSPSWATAITPDAGEFDTARMVVGGDVGDEPWDCPLFYNSPPCTSQTDSEVDAVTWEGDDPSALDRAAPQHMAIAYATDNAGHIVGVAGCEVEPIPTAAFWQDVNADVFDLSSVCGTGGVSEEARASSIVTVVDAITEVETVIAVGGDLTEFGRIWGRVGGPECAWCCDALTARAFPPLGSDVDDTYRVSFAHAVAPSGHIVAHGFRLSETVTLRVLILNCAADLNGDFKVDASDVGLLLVAYGNCPDPGPCDADLNGDGIVDPDDLGLLLLAWSGDDRCTILPGGGGCPSEALSAGAFDSGAAVASAMTLLGFTDLGALAAWYANASEPQRESMVDSLLILFHAFGEAQVPE